MKIYKVGGAVRDELLGLEPTDNDWVVVGSTPKQMLSMGYKQVGKDFPVFLHPDTKEEYALARKERSTGPGHTAFNFSYSPNVTLEEDLSRRDITINAIAKDMTDGSFIDPYNGRDDIKNKIIKHVSESFIEDPLRIFRVARFYTKFDSKFEIDRVLESMMVDMFPDIIHLSGERIWKETEKALNYKNPQEYFYTLIRLCLRSGVFSKNLINKYSVFDGGFFGWGHYDEYHMIYSEENFYGEKNPCLTSPEAWWSIFSFLVNDLDALNKRLRVPKRFQKMSSLSYGFRYNYFKKYKDISREDKIKILYESLERLKPSKNLQYAIDVGFLAAHNMSREYDMHSLERLITKYAEIIPSEDEKKLNGSEIEKILKEKKLRLIEEYTV